MFPEDLQPASYRGAFWLVSSTSLTGGRKNSRKSFINSDLELIEDLGLRQREFTLSGTVSARRNNEGVEIETYQQVRDTLLEALERGGTGVLVHPFHGRLENISVITFTLDESMDRLGDSPISITFGISNATGLPQVEESVIGGVSIANDAVIDAVGKQIDTSFSVTDTFTGNFSDGIDKANRYIDAVNAATDPIAIEAAKIDAFTAELSKFSANVASLVNTPTDLSDSIINLFSTMNGLYSTFPATLESFKRLFDFGDNDVSFIQATAGAIERQKNREILNGSVQTMALSHAYLNASQIDFTNVEEVDEVSQDLETQYQKVIVSGVLDTTVEEAITEMRIQVTKFFDQQRVTRPQVITVQTHLTSSRLLAYQYYGSSDLGNTIAGLNNLDDPTCIEGNVRILTA